MGRQELMRAAEIVLMQAQRVNPLNTDHTANLARLYRAWADFSNLQDQRQALLDKSIDAYDMAVQLSPNAAHLWNEKGNVHLARGERDLAEAAYLHSLSLDERYDQTYLLLADFYEREEALEKASELLRKGIEEIPRSAQLYSFLGVAAARQGNLGEAVEATLKVVELQPNNAAAMRNLALNYRDLELIDESIRWAEQSLAATNPDRVDEVMAAHQLAAQLYQMDGRIDEAITHYEEMRSIEPANADTLGILANLYLSQQNLNGAVDALRRLSELQPDRFEHPFAIAQILQQAGQPTDALSFARQALTLANAEQRPAVEELIVVIEGEG